AARTFGPWEHLDVVAAWTLARGLDIPADIVPCARSELEEEKHEIDTPVRAAFLWGKRMYERRAAWCYPGSVMRGRRRNHHRPACARFAVYACQSASGMVLHAGLRALLCFIAPKSRCTLPSVVVA